MGGFERLFSASAGAMRASAIRRLHTLVQRPGIISFAPGQPDTSMFPVERFGQLAEEVIAREQGATFQYIGTRGLPALVEAIGTYVAERGIAAKPSQILVTEGSQQGLDLLARVLVDPGDAVLVELPSYIGALSAFRAARARLVGVRLDDGGIDLDHLRAQTAAIRTVGGRVKFLYAMPSFQNPGGVSYTADRRRALAELVRELDLVVIEDDPYGDLYFDAEPHPPLKAFDLDDRVVYLSTFSKILAPGLRVGFMIGDEALLAKIEIAKQAADLCGCPLEQHIVLGCLRGDFLGKQKAALRTFYREKRDMLLASLAAEMPSSVTWTRPAGGLFLWATLPAVIDTEAMLSAAVEAGVAYVPGAPFFAEAALPNTMRLTFAVASKGMLAEGARRLASVIRRAAKGGT